MEETGALDAAFDEVRRAVQVLAAAEHCGAMVYRSVAGEVAGGCSSHGAVVLLETMETVRAASGAEGYFGRAAAGVYGWWLFPGLRPPNQDWDTFEGDVTGEIVKAGRKSVVHKCALHPVEVVEKYYIASGNNSH